MRLSPGVAYWSAIQPELVMEHTGVGVVVTIDCSRVDIGRWCFGGMIYLILDQIVSV